MVDQAEQGNSVTNRQIREICGRSGNFLICQFPDLMKRLIKRQIRATPCYTSALDLPNCDGLRVATLEATQGQIDSFFSQLPYKCHQNRVASVGD